LLQSKNIETLFLREFYEYWSSKCRQNRLPARADMSPADIPRLLPYLYLVDVERDPLRFRFRLVGTRVCEWFGHDATGSYVDDPLDGDLDLGMAEVYRQVVESRVPRYVHRDIAELGTLVHCFDRLVLPLVGEDGAVEKLICGLWVRPWQEQGAIAN